MIKLYGFGPMFGLPQSSPFVMKAEVLLKMAGLTYTIDTGGFSKAPKGKQPFIDDDGAIIADSTFIRFHIEKTYGFDFDASLSQSERGVAWAFEKMCEDHLYWAIMHARWMIDANFDKGPRHFFDFLPAPLRPIAVPIIRRQVRRNLWGHGMGRHSKTEIEKLAARDLGAISDFLADKPYLMGPEPCGTDATVFAFVAGALCPFFDSPITAAAEKHPNLVAYRDRLMAQYYPDFGDTGRAQPEPGGDAAGGGIAARGGLRYLRRHAKARFQAPGRRQARQNLVRGSAEVGHARRPEDHTRARRARAQPQEHRS